MKPTRKPPPQLADVVEVEWLDSEHIALGWVPVSHYREAVSGAQSYRSAGYFITGSEDHVIVALSIDPSNGTMTHAMSIPKVCVSGIQVLGRSTKRVRKALERSGVVA